MIHFPKNVMTGVTQTLGMRPRDTGCVFPHGVAGADVRILLVTDDDGKAMACGAKLREWGLPCIPEFIEPRKNEATPALDLFAGGELMSTVGDRDPRRMMFAGQTFVPKFITFGKSLVLLETRNKEDVLRFARWYDEKARQKAAFVEKEFKGLQGLADAGEIETIDAGDL